MINWTASPISTAVCSWYILTSITSCVLFGVSYNVYGEREDKDISSLKVQNPVGVNSLILLLLCGQLSRICTSVQCTAAMINASQGTILMNCLRESQTTVGKGYCGLIIERNNNAVHATAIING